MWRQFSKCFPRPDGVGCTIRPPECAGFHVAYIAAASSDILHAPLAKHDSLRPTKMAQRKRKRIYTQLPRRVETKHIFSCLFSGPRGVNP